MDPASIRYNNPGAMWGGSALTKKWGATKTVGLNDGLGQGNNIAVFPNKVLGAAAQFDLWRTSTHYHNRPLRAAITTWSGGNYVQSYMDFLKKRVPGLTDDTIMNDAFLASPSGVLFMKAQAWHEAGRPYPMPDSDFQKAQTMVFSGKTPVIPAIKRTAGPLIATGGTATAAAHTAGMSFPAALVLGIVLSVFAFVAYRIIQNYLELRKIDQQIATLQNIPVAPVVAPPPPTVVIPTPPLPAQLPIPEPLPEAPQAVPEVKASIPDVQV